MITQDITSRLFYVEGEANLEVAHSTKGDSKPVEKGRCIYRVRLELAPKGHPEITEPQFELRVRTTWDKVYYQRRGKRGPSDDQVTFEELTKSPGMPAGRAKNAKSAVDDLVRKALESVLGNQPFNCTALIYSEFNGYWNAFANEFDETKTYLPIVVQACREVAEHLQSASKQDNP